MVLLRMDLSVRVMTSFCIKASALEGLTRVRATFVYKVSKLFSLCLYYLLLCLKDPTCSLYGETPMVIILATL